MLVATVDSVAQPCPKDFKSYLEVIHVCAPGEFFGFLQPPGDEALARLVAFRAGGRTPVLPGWGGGLTYAQGPHVTYGKNF